MKQVLDINLYTLPEAAALLGVMPQTVSKYIQEGKLTARTIGARKYVSEDALKAFVTTADK